MLKIVIQARLWYFGN